MPSHRWRPLWSLLLGILIIVGGREKGATQALLLNPPRVSPLQNEVVTFDLAVDKGIATAIGWGTTITLKDTVNLQFVNFADGKVFHNTVPFFDTDFSDTSTAGTGKINLLYFNFTPDATLGTDKASDYDNGYIVLGQFQVKLLSNNIQFPNQPNVLLADLGFPPDGSAVMDQDGNNLVRYVTSAILTKNPPTPEPSAWLTMGSGIGLLLFRLYRHRNR